METNTDLQHILKYKKTIPQKQSTGVYFLLDGDEVVYVGRSANLKQRIGAHLSSGKVFDSYHVVTCNIQESHNIEAKYILRFLPKYNKYFPLSGTNLSPVGKTTQTKNRRITIPCTIFNNRLHVDLSKLDFGMLDQQED